MKSFSPSLSCTLPRVRAMINVREVIVVEGRYDKNTLSQVVDAVIIETGGFGIFNDKQKQKLLRKMAEARGIIVLTDSDGAGFVIRNFIKGCVDPKLVKHAYIPDVPGKERRKSAPGKEGKLGVEGMRPEVLITALRRAGATMFETEETETIGETAATEATGETGNIGESRERSETAPPPREKRISKADMYARGLTGTPASRQNRAALIKTLELPQALTPTALQDILNAIMTREQFYEMTWD